MHVNATRVATKQNTEQRRPKTERNLKNHLKLNLVLISKAIVWRLADAQFIKTEMSAVFFI